MMDRSHSSDNIGARNRNWFVLIPDEVSKRGKKHHSIVLRTTQYMFWIRLHQYVDAQYQQGPYHYECLYPLYHTQANSEIFVFIWFAKVVLVTSTKRAFRRSLQGRLCEIFGLDNVDSHFACY